MSFLRRLVTRAVWILAASTVSTAQAEPTLDAGWECGAAEIERLARSGSAADLDALRRILPSGEDFPDSLATSHFLLLFSLDPADERHTTADYVTRLAAYFETAWSAFTADPRFDMPRPYGAGPIGPDGRRILVYVTRRDDVSGSAWREYGLGGPCLLSLAGSILITTGLPDAHLRSTSAHELWHVVSYGLNESEHFWVMESTARWAEWTLWPDDASALGILQFLRASYDAPWNDDWLELRHYGACLFWFFLEQRLHASIVPEVWKGACATSVFESLLVLLEESHGMNFDALIEEFWLWNYYTGTADDGRHYRDGSRFPRIGYQFFEKTSGPEPRSLPDDVLAEPGATNALLFLGPATREHLRITLHGAAATAPHRALTTVATTWPNTHTAPVRRTPDADGTCSFEIRDWAQYDQVVLLVSNTRDASADPELLRYTWTSEEVGAPVFDVDWRISLETMRSNPLINAPNPFSVATMIRYRAAADSPTRLAVFDASGRLVRSLVSGLRSAGGGDFNVAWDGTDEAGDDVSSGIYFLRLATGGTTSVRRLAVVR